MEVQDLDPLLVRILKMGGLGGVQALQVCPPQNADLEGLDPYPDHPPILRMRTRRGPGPGPPWKLALIRARFYRPLGPLVPGRDR